METEIAVLEGKVQSQQLQLEKQVDKVSNNKSLKYRIAENFRKFRGIAASHESFSENFVHIRGSAALVRVVDNPHKFSPRNAIFLFTKVSSTKVFGCTVLA